MLSNPWLWTVPVICMKHREHNLGDPASWRLGFVERRPVGNLLMFHELPRGTVALTAEPSEIVSRLVDPATLIREGWLVD
jgi:hypothetical protein